MFLHRMVGTQFHRELLRYVAMLRFKGQSRATESWHLIGFTSRPTQKDSEEQFGLPVLKISLVPPILKAANSRGVGNSERILLTDYFNLAS